MHPLPETKSCVLQIVRKICSQTLDFGWSPICPMPSVGFFRDQRRSVTLSQTVFLFCFSGFKEPFESNLSKINPSSNAFTKFVPFRSHAHRKRRSTRSGHTWNEGSFELYSDSISLARKTTSRNLAGDLLGGLGTRMKLSVMRGFNSLPD